MTHDMEDCPYREKIEELDDKTSNNEYRIEMLENGDWYSNKELNEKIEGLNLKLNEFNQYFKKYNGLLEKYEKHEERLSQIEKEREKEKFSNKTKISIYDNWKEWLGWGIAFILSLIRILEVLPLWK